MLERFWQVDCLRGIAVCLMLVSNFLFDLFYFADIVDLQQGFAVWLARATAALFLLLVGVSLTLSYARPAARRQGFWKYFRRGSQVFALGMIITAVTRLVVGQDFVVFGILHLIGVGIVVTYPFLRHRTACLVGALVVMAAGFVVGTITVRYPWLLWLGLQYPEFSSVDYTPFVPWGGFILMGIFFGPFFGADGWVQQHTSKAVEWRLVSLLVVCGRRSLVVYFVHQPIFWVGFGLWYKIGYG